MQYEFWNVHHNISSLWLIDNPLCTAHVNEQLFYSSFYRYIQVCQLLIAQFTRGGIPMTCLESLDRCCKTIIPGSCCIICNQVTGKEQAFFKQAYIWRSRF